MKSKLSIQTVITNKTLIIPLILIFSVCLFMTSAFAGGCEGGAGCFKCGQMNHRHAAIPETGFLPTGCQPGMSNSACGISASPLFDSQNFLISTIRVDNHEDSSIPAGLAIDYNADLFSKRTISPDQPSVVTAAPPIYLRNLSFLC
jgi:hypothetical protein